MSHFKQTIDELTFKAACKNKTSAQKKLYELFSDPVYNLILRITHKQEDALDLTQDVFIKVFTKIAQNKSQELIGFWIRKIAINTSMSYLKKHSKIITNVNFKDKAIDNNSNETLDALEFALTKIPALPRTILWLYEVEGLNHNEISEIYGKSVSFSKTHLSRAKALAQSYLQTKGGGYEAVK